MANEVDYNPCKYLGNGSTVEFSFNWKIFNVEDLIVQLEDVSTGEQITKSYGTDYTAIFNETGGHITFNTAPTSSYYVLITRDVSDYQSKRYSTSTGFQGSEVEKSFDRVSCNVQEVEYTLQRAIKVPVGSSILDLTLPLPDAGKTLKWNESETGLVNSTIDVDELESYAERLYESADNIDTVANNILDVNDVADDITSVNTVADKIANVNTVAGSISNVNTVATNISNVNTVKNNIADVNTVAGDIANVNTVAGDKTNIDIVAGDKANIDIVAGDKTNIDTVATNISNVNTVKNSITNVNTVAGSISNVNTVAGDIANVNTVAGDKTNVDTVAGSISNVNTVATNISDVNTVATNISDVNTVASIDDYVVDVAANESNINTVATNIDDVQNAANLIETVYSVLKGGTASSSFTEGVSGGDASSTFTTRIVGGNGSTVGTIIGDIQSNIRVIELTQRNDEADIAQLRADLTTETSERTSVDTGLQNQIDEICDEIILINQCTDGLDERIIENTGDITEAFNQIHSNDDDILAIQLVDEAQSEDIISLQADVTTLQAEGKQIYSVLSGGTASSAFSTVINGGSANTTFTTKLTGGNANSVGSLLADAYNLIRTLTVKLATAFEEIAMLQNKDIDLQNEINAINSITGISGGTATSVFS